MPFYTLVALLTVVPKFPVDATIPPCDTLLVYNVKSLCCIYRAAFVVDFCYAKKSTHLLSIKGSFVEAVPTNCGYMGAF